MQLIQEECLSQESQIFIQYACIQPNEEERQFLALLLGCGSIFVTLFLVNFFDYMQKVQDINYILWDVRTVTSSDYTVEVDIGNEFYQKYKD